MKKKKNPKKEKVFILYEFDKFKNDYKYIKEYYTRSEILEDIKLQNKNSIYQYIFKDINDIKKLLKDRYILIEETL